MPVGSDTGFLSFEITPEHKLSDEGKEALKTRIATKSTMIADNGEFQYLPWFMLGNIITSLVLLIVGLGVWWNVGDDAVYFPLYRGEVIYALQGQSTSGLISAAYNNFSDDMNRVCTTPKTSFKGQNKWNGDTFQAVVYAQADAKLAPWPFAIWVFVVTFMFALFRYMFWNLFKIYDPDGPQFFRWVEYLLSSPMMIVLIAVAAGVRDVGTVAAVAGLQAVLMLIGYMIESFVSDLWNCYFYKLVAVCLGVELETIEDHVVQESSVRGEEEAATIPLLPASASRVSESSYTSSAPSRPFSSRAASTCPNSVNSDHENSKLTAQNALFMMYLMFESHDAAPYTKRGVIADACHLKYRTGRQMIMFRLVMTMVVAWAIFVMIWAIILTAYDNAEKNYNSCTGRGEVPSEIRFLVISQVILFAAFGLNNLYLVYRSYLSVDSETELIRRISRMDSKPGNFDFTEVKECYLEWYKAMIYRFYKLTEWYEVLNIVSKAFLGIAILQISASSGSS